MQRHQWDNLFILSLSLARHREGTFLSQRDGESVMYKRYMRDS